MKTCKGSIRREDGLETRFATDEPETHPIQATDSDRRPLLNAIRAAPADDAPRLVYADWLTENGEGERGEFIRVQCEIARLGPDWIDFAVGPNADAYPELEEERDWQRVIDPLWVRERDLLESHGHIWLGREWPEVVNKSPVLSVPVGFYTFRRGFLNTLTLPAADWLAHADAILSEHPVTSVRFTTTPEVQYDARGDRLRLAGDRWFAINETAAESERLSRIVPPTAESFGYWQHDAHILCRLRWPGITFELP